MAVIRVGEEPKEVSNILSDALALDEEIGLASLGVKESREVMG
jgi:hypothetical protein